MLNHVSLKIIYKYEQSVILCMPEKCVLSYVNKIFLKRFTYQTFTMIQVNFKRYLYKKFLIWTDPE